LYCWYIVLSLLIESLEERLDVIKLLLLGVCECCLFIPLSHSCEL